MFVQILTRCLIEYKETYKCHKLYNNNWDVIIKIIVENILERDCLKPNRNIIRAPNTNLVNT